MTARRLAGAALVLVVALAIAPLGRRTLFDSFTAYDDEGIVLLTLRGYAHGARLYDDLHAQYGPAYYQLLHAAGDLLALPYTHTGSRWGTLVLWLATATLCAGMILHATGCLTLALCVELVVFGGLAGYPNEPLHPGHLLSVLLAVVAWVGIMLPIRMGPAGYAILGLLAGTACVMKINVGVFLGIALGFVVLVRVPTARTHGLVRGALATAFAAVALLLMARALGAPWVWRYAIHVSAGSLAVAIAIAAQEPTGPPVRGRDLGWIVAGFVATIALSAAVALRDGTTPGSLLDGALLAAIRLPAGIIGPLLLPTGALVVGLLSLLVAARTALAPPGDLPLAVGRLIAGVAMLALGVGRSALAFALPLAWVAVVPGRTPTRHASAGVLLAATACLQTLHAYPVAGSQLGWGTFLLPCLGALCVHRGWEELAPWRTARGWSRAFGHVAGGTLAATALCTLLLQWRARVDTHARLVPLGFPGAERVHAARSLAGTYQWLAARVREQCGTFIAIPGLSSLYLFTERAPPTGVNAGVWTLFLEPERQAAVVETLMRTPDLCAIRNRLLLLSWTRNPMPDGPLWRYLDTHFHTVDVRAGYELMVPNAAAPAP